MTNCSNICLIYVPIYFQLTYSLSLRHVSDKNLLPDSDSLASTFVYNLNERLRKIGRLTVTVLVHMPY